MTTQAAELLMQEAEQKARIEGRASIPLNPSKVEYLKGPDLVATEYTVEMQPGCIGGHHGPYLSTGSYNRYRQVQPERTLHVYDEGDGLVWRRFINRGWLDAPTWATAVLLRDEALLMLSAALDEHDATAPVAELVRA